MNRGVKFAQGLHTVSRAVGRQLISLSHAKWITMVRPQANQNALCVNSSKHDAVRLVFTCLHSLSLLYLFRVQQSFILHNEQRNIIGS